jgi:hypothetical protein
MGNRDIAVSVLTGAVRRWVSDAGARRSHILSDLWIDLKCYGSPRVRSVPLQRIRGLDQVSVNGPIGRHSPLVVTAIATLLQSEIVFEIGPDTANTVWLLAHNLPDARIFWLDSEPGGRGADRGDGDDRIYRLSGRATRVRPEQSPEAARITRMTDDSRVLDLLAQSGTADLVYIESSHRSDRIASDTDAAFSLLSELGCIIWDGFSGDAGVYAYLNKLAPELDRPVVHIRGTRLAMYSRWDIVMPAVR